jgi:hypothetical protein
VIADENPAILTIGAYGNTKCICGKCQELLDTATLGREYDKIAEAMEMLGRRMAESTPDDQSFKVVSELLSNAAERARLIKAGKYDFALDDEGDGEISELPEELLETEEDKEKDKRDEEKARKFDKIFNYITAGIFGVAAILIIAKLITTFFG